VRRANEPGEKRDSRSEHKTPKEKAQEPKEEKAQEPKKRAQEPEKGKTYKNNEEANKNSKVETEQEAPVNMTVRARMKDRKMKVSPHGSAAEGGK